MSCRSGLRDAWVRFATPGLSTRRRKVVSRWIRGLRDVFREAEALRRRHLDLAESEDGAFAGVEDLGCPRVGRDRVFGRIWRLGYQVVARGDPFSLA
jgi:hypothetical protein